MHSMPIYYALDGRLYYAALRRGLTVQVWIENADHSLYANFSVPAPWLSLSPREFVAATWGDTNGAMASAMLGTGWFARTGNEVAMPDGDRNEIWRLTQAGEEWLDAMCQHEQRDHEVHAVTPVR